MERDKLFVVSVKPTLNSGADIESCRKFPVNFSVSYVLKLYLDFCYFLCLSPFRLIWDKTTYRYIVRSLFPHKILCAVFTIVFFITEYSRWFRETYPTNPKSASQIFKFLSRVTFFFFRSLYFKIFWFNQLQIKNLVNFILETEF